VRAQAERARRLESRIDQRRCGVVAVGPDQDVHRDVERVGIRRRPAAEDANHGLGGLGGRSAVGKPLAHRVDPRNGFVAGIPAGPVLELGEPLGD
jgi:hypothetical protein